MENIKENKKLVLAIILTAGIFAIFNYIEGILSLDNILIFDTMLGYTPSLFYDSVSILKDNPSNAYVIFRLLDTVFPFIYGYVLYKILSNHSTSVINYLPLVVVVLDLIENTFMIFLTYISNSTNDLPVYLLNIITITKFTIILVILIIIIYRLTRLSRFLNKSEV